MTDLNQLERDLLAQVDAAGDEAALESVRVSALGKKGSVSELLKTLGSMTPRSGRSADRSSTACATRCRARSWPGGAIWPRPPSKPGSPPSAST
jgi:phenylalanyl-tRNA synthetase alpha subunit